MIDVDQGETATLTGRAILGSMNYGWRTEKAQKADD